MRIVLAGSVSFSRTTLEVLRQNNANVVGVLGLSESCSHSVSDYADLSVVASSMSLPYHDFEQINDRSVKETVADWSSDLFFVVGLSQMVDEDLLRMPRIAPVGFHPTWLPQGRGRAPVAWLSWHGIPGAATFFVMESEADSGPILVQEPFFVRPGEYAIDVIAHVNDAIKRALDRWVPQLLSGDWAPTPQDESAATVLGRRAPSDGLIDWSLPADTIVRLVRTASEPYPGAYTYFRGEKVIIWKARVSSVPIAGVAGRVLAVLEGGRFLVQSGTGVVEVERAQAENGAELFFRPGQRLGIVPQDEIAKLLIRVKELEDEVARLTAK